jgi:hypothetical protein
MNHECCRRSRGLMYQTRKAIKYVAFDSLPPLESMTMASGAMQSPEAGVLYDCIHSL